MSVQKDLTTVNDLVEVLRKRPGKDYALEALLDVLPRLLTALRPDDVTSHKEIDSLAEHMREIEQQCRGAASMLEMSSNAKRHAAAIQYLRGAEVAWQTAAQKVQDLHVIPF